MVGEDCVTHGGIATRLARRMSRRFSLPNPDSRYHSPAIASVVPLATVSVIYLSSVLGYALGGNQCQRPAALGAIAAETKWQPLLASEKRGEGGSNDES